MCVNINIANFIHHINQSDSPFTFKNRHIPQIITAFKAQRTLNSQYYVVDESGKTTMQADEIFEVFKLFMVGVIVEKVSILIN